MSRKRTEEEPLRGWRDIAGFLGQSVGTAQRWGKEGMPVRHQGRYVTASREELSRWLGRESGTAEPVEIATGGDRDLVAKLRRGIAEVQRRRKQRRVA